MNAVHISKRVRIECDDYPVGPYTPVSFIPHLNWVITKSEFIDHPNPMPRLIIIESIIGAIKISLTAKPYSFGKFELDSGRLEFGWPMMDTNDPEDAIFRAESWLLVRALKQFNHYKHVVERLSI